MSTTRASDPSIRITVGGVELECPPDVDPEHLTAVLRSVREALPAELLHAAASEPGAREPSLADFVAHSHAKTFGDKACVIAFWLESYGGRADWRTGDILAAFDEAGETRPVNLTDALNQKARKGVCVVEDRRWKLTEEGRGWVRLSLLPNDEA